MLEQLLASLAGAPPQNRLNMLPPGMDERAAMSNPQAIAAMLGQGPAMGAPSPAPMPQQPAQAPQQPSGGGFLQSLFSPRASGENATIGWLQTQGMDQGTATLLARNKTALQSYLLNRTKGRDPMVINGRVVDPNTYEVLADFSDKSGDAGGFTLSEGQTRYDESGRVIARGADKATGGYRMLSPEEVRARGLPPGSYQVNNEGKVDVVGGVRDQDAGLSREKDLRKEYTSRPEFKRYDDVRASYGRVRSAAEQNSGAGDVGLIFGFMKMLDPGSVVREGEFATAENTTGVPGRIVNLYNRVIQGERLTPEQRREFVSLSGNLYAKEVERIAGLNDYYTNIASQWGIDPGRIIMTPEVFGEAGNVTELPALPGTQEPAAPQGPLPKAGEATLDFLRTMPMPKAYKDGGGTEQGWRFISPEKRRLWLDE